MNHYVLLLRNRPFRLFWTGFTFSVIGDAMTRVALTWFVYERTKSAAALGLLTLAYTGPVLLGGLLSGWLLDRFDRRKVMLADNLLRGLGMAVIPLLFAFQALEMWVVYLAVGVYGSLMMISLAGSPALVPSLVPRERLDTANALETLSFTLSGVIGPPLAGLLIAWIGAPNVVLIDVLSYLGFALALARLRPPAQEEERAQAGEGRYRLTDALRLLVQNRVLLSTTLMFMAFNFGFGILTVWLPIYVDQAAGGGAGLYGLLLGILAAGEVLSSLLVGAVALPLSLGSLIALSQLFSGAALGLLLLGPQLSLLGPRLTLPGPQRWILGAGLALFGFFSAPLTIWAQTLRMRLIPERLRGRTFALLRTLMQGAMPAGGALGGLLLPVLGIGAMIGLSAILAGAPGLAGYSLAELREAGGKESREAAMPNLPES